MAQENKSNNTSAVLKPTKALSGTEKYPPGHVLIVDDQRTTLTKISRAVQYLGHTVVAVDNASDALAALQKENFDAIFTGHAHAENGWAGVSTTQKINRKNSACSSGRYLWSRRQRCHR